MAKVLVIDDDPEVRLALVATLESAGHVVTDADNGKTGIAKFRANPVDLVLTDLVMPEQEGMETIVALHREWPALRIIAMSGYVERDAFLAAAHRLGAHRTLTKPFAGSQLLAAIDSALQES